MRKLYIPIFTDPQHSFEQYDKDFSDLGANFIYLVEPCRLVHAVGERYRRALSSLKDALVHYESKGYECGIWLSTLGFGGPIFGDANPSGDPSFKPYTCIRSLDGKEEPDAICPTDPAFSERACQVIKDLARIGVKNIMLDDELCLSVRPGIGCACDNHLHELGKRFGKKVTLSELPELIFTGKTAPYRKEWLNIQGDTLRNFCKKLRSALDEIDPEVRMGFCAGYTSWDLEGVDAIELTRILAGKTKPFLRFSSAPYWIATQRFGRMSMPTLIEFARIQTAWTKNTDIEVFTECDTYPHDIYHTPVSLVQCFDTANLLTEGVGVLKYFYHYPCKPETERGYINAHLSANKDAVALISAFRGKTEIGVRVYEQMRRLGEATLPESFDQRQIMRKYGFSEAQKMLTVNAIPTVYEGEGLCGIVFGENVRALPKDAFGKGLILDLTAAEILQNEMGIDTGLRSAKPIRKMVLEDFGTGTPVSVYWASDLYEIETADTAKPLSRFVEADFLGDRRSSVSAYLYENGSGMRFLVYAFRAEGQREDSGVYWNYRRGEQIAGAIEWLGGEPLPVNCTGAPFGYLRCNRNGKRIAIAYFNCGTDPVESLDFRFCSKLKSFDIAVGSGEMSSQDTITLHGIASYGYAAIEAEIE